MVCKADVSIQAGGNNPFADGVNDVFMQSPQILQFSAGVLQLHSDLPQLGRQPAGKIRDCQIREEVDEDDGLQRL